MDHVVSYEQRGAVALIQINNPPVNALSREVRRQLAESVETADKSAETRAVVIYGAGSTFIAGADIKEFAKPTQEPYLPDVLQQIEALDKPVVAALQGAVLGGGFETALHSHYRIALESTRLGFPEINLGLIPGAGGTQLLPRLIGAEKSIELISSGRQMSASEALELGVIDCLASENLIVSALEFARELVDKKTVPRRLSEARVDAADLSPDFFPLQRQALAKNNLSAEAAQRCVDAVEISVNSNFSEGRARERDLFLKLMESEQSKALRHLFFAERNASKFTDEAPDQSPGPSIASVGIVGAGTMGTGIAINFLSADLPVVLLETSQEALDRGAKTIADYYMGRVSRGRMSADAAERCLSLLGCALDYAQLSNVDLAIEAVFEDMQIKQEVFKKLDVACKSGAILASNTSTLDVDQMAAATGRPQKVLGLHFFSPAQVMRLLEVVRGKETDGAVLQSILSLAKQIRKVAVVSGVCDGFIGNRMLKGYRREASALLLEGAIPEQVDGAARAFGMAMGPLAVGDLAGLDIGYSARKQRLERGDYVDPIEGAVADRLVEQGRKGQKSGAGYYRYQKGSRTPIPDPQTLALIESVAAEFDIKRHQISQAEITERLMLPLVNEGARILDEQIAQRSSDIDLVWVHGYGFPRYRGGPMFYADNLGLEKILERLKYFQNQFGDHWSPSPLLESLVAKKRSFSN